MFQDHGQRSKADRAFSTAGSALQPGGAVSTAGSAPPAAEEPFQYREQHLCFPRLWRLRPCNFPGFPSLAPRSASALVGTGAIPSWLSSSHKSGTRDTIQAL